MVAVRHLAAGCVEWLLTQKSLRSATPVIFLVHPSIRLDALVLWRSPLCPFFRHPAPKPYCRQPLMAAARVDAVAAAVAASVFQGRLREPLPE